MYIIVIHNTEIASVYTTTSLEKAFILAFSYARSWVDDEVTDEDIEANKWHYNNGLIWKSFMSGDGLDLNIQINSPSRIKFNNDSMNRVCKMVKKELDLSEDKKMHDPIYIRNPHITDSFDMSHPQYIEIKPKEFKKLK